jgi:hypothetical protein
MLILSNFLSGSGGGAGATGAGGTGTVDPASSMGGGAASGGAVAQPANIANAARIKRREELITEPDA